MHHDRVQSHLAQEHHVFGEAGFQMIVDHRIAAILDDDGLSVKFLDVGQRLDEDGCLILGCECHTILPLSLAPVYQV